MVTLFKPWLHYPLSKSPSDILCATFSIIVLPVYYSQQRIVKQDGAWHHLKVPSNPTPLHLTNSLKFSLQGKVILAQHLRNPQTQSNHSGFQEPTKKKRGNIQPVHLNEQRCSIRLWLTVLLRPAKGTKSQGKLVEQKITLQGLSCRSEMIPLCEIHLEPTKWNLRDLEEWCRVSLYTQHQIN